MMFRDGGGGGVGFVDDDGLLERRVEKSGLLFATK